MNGHRVTEYTEIECSYSTRHRLRDRSAPMLGPGLLEAIYETASRAPVASGRERAPLGRGDSSSMAIRVAEHPSGLFADRIRFLGRFAPARERALIRRHRLRRSWCDARRDRISP